jgi:hypothetical protein
MKNRRQITSTSHRIPVQIGDVGCSIECYDRRISGRLKKIYAGFLSHKQADIRIELDTIQRFGVPPVDIKSDSVKIIKSFEEISMICSFNTCQPFISRPNVRVVMERKQFNPGHGYKFMNWLLRNAYYTVKNKRHRDILPAMLIHACGIIRKRHLLIFTGPSGIGKTTIARMCGNEHGKVANDEMLLITGVETDGSRLMAQGLPIIGGVRQRSHVKVPVLCVMTLKQAQRTSIRPLDRVEAYLRIMRQIVAPTDLIENDDTKTMITKVTGFADSLTKAVPCYELEFTLEEEPLWKAVEEIEESLMTGESKVWRAQ